MVLATFVVAGSVAACSSSRPPARPGATDRKEEVTAPLTPEVTGPASEESIAGGAALTTRKARQRSLRGGEAPGPAKGEGPAASPALFAAADDRVGISQSTVRLCTHYRKYLGKVAEVDEADLAVYWTSINDEHGGIFGRKIEERTVEDDGGRLAAQAYEECRGSFLIRGGPGAEGIAPIRSLNERDTHPAPYIHFTARSDPDARYSFSFYPSHEVYGRLSGQYVLSRFAGKRIGIIHKDSYNWQAGHKGFLDALRDVGASVVADVPLAPGDAVVADELAAVHEKGAEVVWAWVEGLDVIQLIKQSNAQRYPMRWVAPFANNFLVDALGDDAMRPHPVTGLSLFAPMTPGHTAAIPSYAEEYRRFEQTYRRYRGKAVKRLSADLLFLKWLDDRELARLLERCGPECTRNRLVAPLVAADFSASNPNCAFDFRRGRAAGYRASAFEVTASQSGPLWTETAHCADRF